MTPWGEKAIEHVARAQAENAGFAWEACAQNQWRSDARAGILAFIAVLKEPSKEMSHAAWLQIPARLHDNLDSDEIPINPMLRAILTEADAEVR